MPRLVGGQQFGLHLLAADLHGELVNLRPARDGEQIGAFEALRVGVVKVLVNRSGGDLAGDLHVDVMRGDFQGRVGPVGAGVRDDPPVGLIHDDQPVRPRGGDRARQKGQNREKE
jgi:hypothetical protein